MRIFLTGDGHENVAAARTFCSMCAVGCRVVLPMDGFSNVRECDCRDSQLVASIGRTIAELDAAVTYEQSGQYYGHVLVASSMPLMRHVRRDGEKSMYPFDSCADGVSEDVWRACEHLLRSAYSSIGFDYVFRVQGTMPERGLLQEMGVLRDGQPVLDVRGWEEVADIVNYEFRSAELPSNPVQ